MSYPGEMTVVVPDIVIAEGDQAAASPTPLVFLNAFAVLKVERAGRGFRFEEAREVDETGTRSAYLLDALTSHLDLDTTLAGYRLDRVIDALVQVPFGDPHEATCKPALLRLKAALANEVQDAHWYDRDRHRSLELLAGEHDLPAEWHRPQGGRNLNMLERELSAKAQSVWLSIAHEWLTTADLRRALADYDQWRTAHSIA